MGNRYETVIGLEIHAELSTASKLFCNSDASFGGDPNTKTGVISTGMPGVLPVLNRRALEFSVRAGLATNCQISNYSKFDRKNYFYPDLPKGYQITQYDLPICYDGHVDFEFEGETKRVRINRIHLEEDAGKLVHGDVTGNPNRSYVDFNRAGVPLLEIVTEPDLRSPEEAIAFWRAVKEILEYIEISDCNMEEGSFRCDANISIRPTGSKEFGIRTELKNKNSFQHVLAALKYEQKRQAQILDEGGKIQQVTLKFDTESGKTSPMRSKEEAHDYRYFPEPDLVPFEVNAEEIEQMREEIPELPAELRKRFTEEYAIPTYDASVLTSTRQMAEYFDQAVKLCGDAKACSNWIMGDLSALLNDSNTNIADCQFSIQHLSELIQLIENGTISGKIAKSVIASSFENGKMPSQIVDEEGLSQISDSSEIEGIVDEVISANQESAQDYINGKKKALGFLVGQVMKATKGKANPKLANQILTQKLTGE